MLTIGFTEQYYTLWVVGEPYKEYVDEYNYFIKQDCTYCQNLSFDFNEAKAKVEAKNPGIEYRIELDLRGDGGSFTRGLGDRVSDAPKWMFSFGKLKYQDIRECDDVWQLDRAYLEEKNARTRVYARRRLIELGEFVRYTKYESREVNVNWGKVDENWKSLPELYETIQHRVNWISKVEFEKIQKANSAPVNDHYEDNGSKVTIEVKEFESFGFNGMYGWTNVITYMDKSNRAFKYVGSASPNISDEWVKIQATIDHSNYNGKAETKLKRIKVLN